MSQAVAAPLVAVFPWLEVAYAPFLVSAANICSGNPELPEQITPADIFGAAVTPVFGETFSQPLLAKINALVNYAAFQQLCQCNGNPLGCQSQTIPLHLGTNLSYTGGGLQFVWPCSNYGIGPCTREYYQWPQGCETVDVTIWHGAVGSAGQPQLVTRIFDCQGQLYGQSHIMGTPQAVTLRPGGCASFAGAGINLTWDWNVDPNLHPDWTAVIAPHAGQGPGPTPPPDPPPPDLPNVPPHPPLPCDSTSLCQIQWNFLTQINTAINTNVQTSRTILDANPTSYALGNSYTLTGSGVQVVAQDTLGVAVEFVSIPPQLVPAPTDPPRYYDIGWIALAAADVLDGKKWLHSSGERFMPAFPEMDRVHYNLTDGVTVQLHELVPPAAPA